MSNLENGVGCLNARGGKLNNPVIYVVIAIVLVGNLYLITKSVKAFFKYSATLNWEPVEGTLKSSDYQKVVEGDRSGAATWESYEVFSTYRYKARGSIYTHEVKRAVANKEQAQAFQQGDTLILYFDPNNPQNALGEKASILDFLGVIGGLIVFNLFMAGIAYQVHSFFSEEM